MTLFNVKPWQFKGRRTERNVPIGRKCDETCTHKMPSLNSAMALCSVCHELFGTVRNFDRHRKAGWCQDPAAMGLRLTEMGVWRTVMDPDQLNRFMSISEEDENYDEMDQDTV